MNALHYLLSFLLVIAHRSLASFPSNFVEEEPTVAASPEQIAQVPVGPVHVAPVVVQVPAAAPAPYYPHSYPSVTYSHYYHPRTEVRNIQKSYEKETGHASETSVVSDDGHLSSTLGVHPEHLADGLALPGPFRSRLHRKKLAKKVHKSRAHKSFDKRKN